jgi:methyl-accepting chemotaxis protein
VDQVTQRNASAAEELASTAEELTAQAESLQQLMAFFRMNEIQAPAIRRPAFTPAPAPRPQVPAPLAARRPDVLQAAMAPAAHGGDGSLVGTAAPADRDFTGF